VCSLFITKYCLSCVLKRSKGFGFNQETNTGRKRAHDTTTDNDSLIPSKKEYSLKEKDLMQQRFRLMVFKQKLIDNIAPPISKECLDSDFFNKHFKNPFNINHLQLINSTYFGHRDMH
jgi:hypothetical protein